MSEIYSNKVWKGLEMSQGIMSGEKACTSPCLKASPRTHKMAGEGLPHPAGSIQNMDQDL